MSSTNQTNSEATEIGVLQKITGLPKLLNEISGITKHHETEAILAICDSGNPNKVYVLNKRGEIEESIKIKDANNKDWESITHDSNGNIYIGDIGNNYNNREDLVIYKIKNLFDKKSKSQKIKFTLEDQKKFPPKKKNRNFDLEAMIHLNDHLYLFSKNKSRPFTGYTKVYQLPDEKGKYNAKLIGQYQIGTHQSKDMITDAAVSPDQKTIALLTHDKVILLSDWKSDNFFSGKIDVIPFNHNSQKESITFMKNNLLYIADENESKMGSASLYQLLIR